MNFQVTLFPLFFLSLCTSTISSLNDFFPTLNEEIYRQESSYIVWFDNSMPYVKYIIDYYKKEPQALFEEAFPNENIYFNELLFAVISSRNFDIHGMNLNSDRTLLACQIRRDIEKTIISILFESSSRMKFKKKISLINILIKFLEKYAQLSYFRDTYDLTPAEVSKRVEFWEYLIKGHLYDSLNGIIQYDLLFSFVFWPIDSENLVLPFSSDDEFVGNCLIFYSSIHQIIDNRDFKIFEFDHFNRILPIVFILDNIDDSGASLILPNTSSFESFHYKFDYFFCREKNLDLLVEKIIEKKHQIVEIAKGKVDSEMAQLNYIFHLTASFEHYFNENKSQDNQNILFQLKCLTIIEEFMNLSRHKLKRPSRLTEPQQQEKIFDETNENQILNTDNFEDSGVESSDISYEEEEAYEEDTSVDDGDDSEDDIVIFNFDEASNEEKSVSEEDSDSGQGAGFGV
jgi:hypothetical protein